MLLLYIYVIFIYLFIGNFMQYKSAPTEFEVQSLAFGILRKNLYPEYLIRGEYAFPKMRADIAIFKAHKERAPELMCIIEVKKSSNGYETAQKTRYEDLTGVTCVYIRGYEEAYDVINRVKEFL